MKRYLCILALVFLAILAACGGSPQVIIETPTPTVPAAPTIDVNVVQTQAASSVFATETAAVPTPDIKAAQTQAAASVFATETAAAPPASPTSAPTQVPPAVTATQVPPNVTATQVPTIVAPSSNGSFITDIVLATGTQGDNFDPVGVTSVFSPDATFHTVVTIVDAPDNSKFKAEWFVVDVGSAAAPNSSIDQYELTTQGSRNIDFTLKPKTTWPEGSYRVDISANGTLIKSLTFNVKGASSQATLPATAAAIQTTDFNQSLDCSQYNPALKLGKGSFSFSYPKNYQTQTCDKNPGYYVQILAPSGAEGGYFASVDVVANLGPDGSAKGVGSFIVDNYKTQGYQVQVLNTDTLQALALPVYRTDFIATKGNSQFAERAVAFYNLISPQVLIMEWRKVTSSTSASVFDDFDSGDWRAVFDSVTLVF